jgi:1,4-dihydroxy-2-naphthoate octaprenyltransferase
MNEAKKFSSHSKLSLWWLAARPRTLPAAAAPVVVGTAVAIADNFFSFPPALAAFLGALFLQLGVNLANDYFDAKHQIDTKERLGPVRVTQSGLIPARHVKLGMICCLAIAAVCFVYLGAVGGLPLIVIGICSILAALAYSGGPYPLASNSLGELFVFIFFGLVAVCGTYWAQALSLSQLVIFASLPPGLLITAIMVVNNLRDIETDRKAGKFTLAVRLGKENTKLFYQSLLWISYLVPLALLLHPTVSLPVLLPLLTTFSAWRLHQEIITAKGKELNETLARTARLSFLFSFLFALGLVL